MTAPVMIMVSHRTGDKTLYEPMMAYGWMMLACPSPKRKCRQCDSSCIHWWRRWRQRISSECQSCHPDDLSVSVLLSLNMPVYCCLYRWTIIKSTTLVSRQLLMSQKLNWSLVVWKLYTRIRPSSECNGLMDSHITKTSHEREIITDNKSTCPREQLRNTQTPVTGPLLTESSGDWWIPLTKDQ